MNRCAAARNISILKNRYIYINYILLFQATWTRPLYDLVANSLLRFLGYSLPLFYSTDRQTFFLCFYFLVLQRLDIFTALLGHDKNRLLLFFLSCNNTTASQAPIWPQDSSVQGTVHFITSMWKLMRSQLNKPMERKKRTFTTGMLPPAAAAMTPWPQVSQSIQSVSPSVRLSVWPGKQRYQSAARWNGCSRRPRRKNKAV